MVPSCHLIPAPEYFEPMSQASDALAPSGDARTPRSAAVIHRPCCHQHGPTRIASIPSSPRTRCQARRKPRMRGTARLITTLLLAVVPPVGLAMPAYAEVMQGDGHLEGKSTACVGPLFVDGANGGFIASGHVSPHADQWTVRATSTSAPTPFVTVIARTDTDLNQFSPVTAHP